MLTGLDWLNTSKSAASMPPCTLLLLTGVLRLACSRSIAPSPRFSWPVRPGVVELGIATVRDRGRSGSNLTGGAAACASNRNSGGFCSLFGSDPESSVDADAGLFSSPELDRDSVGVTLPWCDDSPKARRIGLRVYPACRLARCDFLKETENRFLGGGGVLLTASVGDKENSDFVCAGICGLKPPCADSGDKLQLLRVGVCANRCFCGFEGERDMERRRSVVPTASMWCAKVGEGR